MPLNLARTCVSCRLWLHFLYRLPVSQVAGSSSHERPTKAVCGGTLSCKALRYEATADGKRNYGLGMDALATACLLEHERYYGLAMDALVIALMER